MQRLIRLALWTASFTATISAIASPLPAVNYDQVVYLADDTSTSLVRYSLASESFLTPITLSQAPRALQVDDSGIYVSHGSQVDKLALDGSTQSPFYAASNDVVGVKLTQHYLLVQTYYALLVIDKQSQNLTGQSVQALVGNMALSADQTEIYGIGPYSPSDIYRVPLSSNGTLGQAMDSPYHGTYSHGLRSYKFPGVARVVDSSGNVYNASNLTHAGALGDAFTALDFWQTLPIVLRNNRLFSYDKAMRESGQLALSNANSFDLQVVDNKVYVFSQDTNNQPRVEIKAVSELTPADPDAPLSPDGLAYTPDKVILDKDGDTLYLLSKSQQIIFRWSISRATYLASITLVDSPEYIAYAAQQNRLYLSYHQGRISAVDTQTLVESDFLQVSAPNGLAVVNNYLIYCSGGGYDTCNFQSYDKDAQLVGWHQVWAPGIALFGDNTLSKLYYISTYTPNDLQQLAVGETGELGQDRDSPDHGELVWSPPISVSQSGRYVALGSGVIVDSVNMQLQSSLSNFESFSDIAWMYGNLFSIKTVNSDTRFEHWNSDYSNDTEMQQDFSGSPIALVAIPSANKLLVVHGQEGIPQFSFVSFSEGDFDQDGVPDTTDLFPADPIDAYDLDSDGIGDNADTDVDGDGVDNNQDAFPRDPQESLDTDKDGLGNNADDDDDDDGVPDSADRFPLDPDESADTDNDGIGDNADPDIDGDYVLNENDALPYDRNESKDFDGDGIGDNSDPDDDNDQVIDSEDAFPFDPAESKDTDHDGIGDNADPDSDGDGYANNQDAFPLNRNEWHDADNDGTGDNADLDDDNDGVADAQDFYPYDASRASFNANDFLPLIAGSHWSYDISSTQVTLGSELEIANQKILPLQLPSGAKLYLKVVNNQIQLLGLYLPQVDTGYGSYSTDFKLDTGINLLDTNYVRGTGKVEILPKYGNKNLNWSANINHNDIEPISVPAGNFTTEHSSLDFYGNATVDGQEVGIVYSVDFWFAPDFGLVKMSDSGQTMNLVQATIAKPSNPGSSGDGTSTGGSGSSGGSSSGGGGGSTNPLLLLLLLTLIPTRLHRR